MFKDMTEEEIQQKLAKIEEENNHPDMHQGLDETKRFDARTRKYVPIHA